jgi:hypothetical protein
MLFDCGKRNEALVEVERVLHDTPNRRNAMALVARGSPQ